MEDKKAGRTAGEETWDRTIGAGLPWLERNNRTSRKSWDRTARTGQFRQENNGRTARTGQLGQDRRNSSVWTGRPDREAWKEPRR